MKVVNNFKFCEIYIINAQCAQTHTHAYTHYIHTHTHIHMYIHRYHIYHIPLITPLGH